MALQVRLGHLTAASTSGPPWGLSLTYGGFGNRTNQSLTKGLGPTVSLSINPANNRINSSGYTYDANGNLSRFMGHLLTRYTIDFNRCYQQNSKRRWRSCAGFEAGR